MDLWETFTQKLQRAGYTLDDIADCSDHVFLSVVDELGGFTALQTAKLQTEMKRRLRMSASRQHSRSSTPHQQQPYEAGGNEHQTAAPQHQHLSASPPSTSVLIPLRARTAEHDTIYHKAAALLFSSGVSTPISSVVKFVDVPDVVQAFYAHQQSLHDPNTTPILRFLWMSVQEFRRLAVAGGSFDALDGGATSDSLCPSGIVLYAEDSVNAKPTRTASSDPTAQGACPPHDVLVAVDVIVGKAKLMDERDVQQIRGFAMRHFQRSLHEEGYDSIQVVRSASGSMTDALVVLHPHQLLARYAVLFDSLPSALLDNLGGTGGSNARIGGTLDSDGPSTMRVHGVVGGGGGGGPMLHNSHPVPATADDGFALLRTPAQRCPTHSNRALEFWCPEEKKLICSHCLFHGGYNKKTCALLDDGAASEVHDLQTWTRNAATFLRDIQSVEKLFQTALSEIEDEAQQQIQDARALFYQLRRAIDAAEGSVVEEIVTSSREESQKLERAAAAVSQRVAEVEELHGRANRCLSRDRLDGSGSFELLSVTQRAFGRWNAIAVPSYEVLAVQAKVFPTPAQISAAVSTALTRRDGAVNLPEAIDVNFLQVLK